MKALYSTAGAVPVRRVLREYRAAVVPLAVILIVNLVAFVVVMLPLAARVTATERRAEAAEQTRAKAEAEFVQAESLRAGRDQATGDLETFYAKVLPPNVAAARRLLQLKLPQQAREHDVRYQGGGTTEQEIRDSQLLRLTMQTRLTGEYRDIRAFIHALETAPEFVVIDNLRLVEGNDGGALAVYLDVSTYYRARTPAATSAPSAPAAPAAEGDGR